MSDIGLTWDNVTQCADFTIDENDLESDGGLETAVLISLYTDAALELGDVLPEGETDRRGWWGDAAGIAVVEGDRIGSHLWLRARSRETPALLDLTDEDIRGALQWMLDDQISDSIEITDSQFPVRGVITSTITIHRPKRDSVEFRFNRNWAAQAERV